MRKSLFLILIHTKEKLKVRVRFNSLGEIKALEQALLMVRTFLQCNNSSKMSFTLKIFDFYILII